MLKDLAAGTNGGFAITAVGHPFDTIKIRMQTQPVDNPLYSGTWDCMKKTLKWEGVGGLYRGVTSPLVGNAFFNATQFLAYGQAKKLFRPDGNEDAMTVTQFLGCGIMTGTLVSFVESPIDLFKSQMQVQIFRSRITGEPPAYRSVPDVVRQVVSGYGLRGFYQGLSATMCRDIPAVSLYFSTYEATRKALVKEGESVSDLPSWKVRPCAPARSRGPRPHPFLPPAARRRRGGRFLLLVPHLPHGRHQVHAAERLHPPHRAPLQRHRRLRAQAVRAGRGPALHRGHRPLPAALHSGQRSLLLRL